MAEHHGAIESLRRYWLSGSLMHIDTALQELAALASARSTDAHAWQSATDAVARALASLPF